jgi:hypothetical protein
MESQSGLDHVAALLGETGYLVESRSPEGLLVIIPVVHADSVVIHYRIEVTGSESQLTAAEAADGCRLPRLCPERHIVGSGRFCIYWDRDQRFDVTDRESAERWLDVLTDFLRSQRRAAVLRLWPTKAWAHGEAAAEAQHKAEKAGAALGSEWEDLVSRRRLKIEKREDGILSVSRGGEYLLSAWLAPRRRTRQGARIVAACEMTGKGRKVCKNRVRGQQLYDLALALWEWKRAEANVWKSLGHLSCCGTMDGCGLRLNPKGIVQ